MRRKDREVTDTDQLLEIIDRCKVCRIGLQDEEGIYIVPVNFGYEYAGNRLTLYCHSAKEGRKISALQTNPQVCVEMDCGHELIEAREACGYGYRFASVIGTGRAVLVDSLEEKKHGLVLLMRHQTGREFSFRDEQAGAVAVLRVDVESFTGKRHG